MGLHQGLWVKCCCGNFFCQKHQKHAYECDCPPIEEMDFDPYFESEKQ